MALRIFLYMTGLLLFSMHFLGCSKYAFAQTVKVKPRSEAFYKETTLANIHSLTSAQKKLEKAFKTLQYDPEKDHLVLMVHGRGKHPQKAYRKILPFVEGQYQVKVILFHWPGSWNGVIAFPQEKAFAAKNSFRYVVKALNAYKELNSKMRSCVLFTHSMGSLVLEAYIRKFSQEFDSDLFDNILVDASASALQGHRNWVNKIECKKNVYITFNNNDLMLKLAGVYGTRLGKDLNSLFEGKHTLAEKVCYIDFSKTGVGGGGHKYYIAKYQRGSLNIHHFYQQVLQGKVVNLKNPNHFRNTLKNIYKILAD